MKELPRSTKVSSPVRPYIITCVGTRCSATVPLPSAAGMSPRNPEEVVVPTGHGMPGHLIVLAVGLGCAPRDAAGLGVALVDLDPIAASYELVRCGQSADARSQDDHCLAVTLRRNHRQLFPACTSISLDPPSRASREANPPSYAVSTAPSRRSELPAMAPASPRDAKTPWFWVRSAPGPLGPRLLCRPDYTADEDGSP